MDSKFYFSGFVEPARATSDLGFTCRIDSICDNLFAMHPMAYLWPGMSYTV